MKTIQSPFKFLEAYTLKDKDVFFGRNDEIGKLFSELKKNRLVLVYGQTGTGKTSLIQCGLASKYQFTDWFPIFIRRQENINLSLDRFLTSALSDLNDATRETVEDYPKTLQRIFALSLRPVYLIFDQFEELLILGDESEKAQFVHTIESILKAKIACRILFVLREEYLSQLYDFEKVIPTLMDSRLRVEPMNNAQVAQVIDSSFRQFNITLEKAEVDLVDLMIKNIGGSRTGIPLPYLQVYLDMLYKEDIRRMPPDQLEAAGPYPDVRFTKEEIDALGPMDDVLEMFLDEQIAEMENHLPHEYHKLGENPTGRVLDLFVTEEGTKRPVNYDLQDDLTIIDPRVKQMIPGFSHRELTYFVNELDRRRILKNGRSQLSWRMTAWPNSLNGEGPTNSVN